MLLVSAVCASSSACNIGYSKLNLMSLVPTAVCQYNRHLFDSQLLLNIINVHPLACVGMELYDNFYYIPPTDWSANDKPAVFLKYWLRNLRDRKKVEEELNLAKEVALSESKAKTEFLNSMSHEIRTRE